MAVVTDVVTLAEARTALNQGSQTANDTEIAALVTAVSESLDSDDGIGPTVIRDIAEETYDGRGTAIQLNHYPVFAITSVTEDGTALTATDYHCDTETGTLYRRSGDYDTTWEVGRDNVAVVYRAGRVASTALVTERTKQGASMILKHLWRSEQWNISGVGDANFEVPQVAFPAFAIPNAVREWFGGEWRSMKGGFA